MESKVTIIMQEMLPLLNNEQLLALRESLEHHLVDGKKQQKYSNNNLLQLFITAKQVEGCSSKTIRYYQRTIENLFNAIKESVTQLTTDDLRSYLANYQSEKDCSKANLDNIRRILSSFFAWLEQEEYIIKNPIRRIKKIKTEQNVKETYTDEHLEIMRDNCENLRDLAIIDLLASTGMRVGELVQLNRSDIDFENRECVVFGKGKKERPVYFDARTKIHCKDLFGPEQDKENFLVFDYGDNFDYFRADPRDGEGRHIVSLTQRLFNIKVDLIRELQGLQYQEDQFARAYRQQLVSELQGRIESLNELDFRVRMVLDTVYSYRKLESWQNLTAVTSETIQKNLSPLLFDEDKEDEMARRFDLWLLHIQLGQLTAKSSTVHISQVMKTARALSAIGNIPQVFEQAEIIRKVQEPEFWKEVNLSDLEKIRLAIRDLLQFLDKTDRKPYYVNFEDRILSTVHETTAFLQVNDLRSYNEKVEHYLKTHLDEESISKLYHNKKLTSDDMLALEKLLWEKLGSKADYQSHYENKAIPRLVREIIGLDRESANRIFSKFLSDENLNARQISFVKLIVDYIVENGFLETKVLTQEPFKSYGSVQLLFQHQLPVLRNIVQIIELINNRAGEAA